MIVDLKRKSAKVKEHPTPKKKAAEAQAAAKGPANERAAGGKAKQVDKIKEAKTKKPDSNSFLALLRAEIEKAMPKTLGDTEKFMKGGDAGALKGSLKGNVSQQKQEATGDTAQASKQAPGEAGEAKQSTPIPAEPQPPAPDVDGAAAMPAPKSEADVSLKDSKQDTDAALADAEVTPTQLKKANDPRFSAVLSAKDTVAKQADTAPAKFRAGERGALTSAGAQAKNAAKQGASAMVGTKTKAKSAVQLRQEAAKKKDELERKKVADDIEAIYNKTKTSVENKLATLETEVGAIFDSGTESALSAMKNYVEDRLFRYKLDRYLSIPGVGAARWVADQFMGLPDEVNVFYVEGRNLFTRMMDALVVRVANLVEKRLAEAKALVAAGQNEIKVYVSKLPANLRSVGESAEREMAGRFKELEQGIEDKKNQLAQSLAQKYKEASEKADKALKEIQDANKGLVQAFVEKLGEIVKILAEFKDKLMALLKKGADAIKLILADPIGFLGNLIGAIKQGFSLFRANIKTWLIKGLTSWLFGALASAGVSPPADFSLPSIFKLVMQILGLTYENMRAKAVKLLGPTAVTVIEQLVKYIQTFITGGPAKLWEQVKADLANLKEMVLGSIRDMIIETVIKAAVTKLLSMFNPAGAIVQAIMAIYNTVMFVIEQGAQIMAFVDAILNSVMAIAQGAIGAAAAKVEQSLGAAVPLVIGFFARLIGLGDIPKRATAVVKKVQKFIDAAIDKFLAKAIAFVKKLFGAGKPKKPMSEKEREEQVKKGVAALGTFTQKFAKKGATQEQVDGAARKVQSKFPVFQSITPVAQGDKWVFEYVASPKRRAPGPQKGKPTFTLTPGPLKLQEGKIISAKKTVHLYTDHGPDKLEADVEQRLIDELNRFKAERTKKFNEMDKSIADTQKKLEDLVKGEQPKKPDKIAKRLNDIERYTKIIESAIEQKKKYTGINERDRRAIQNALADLDKDKMTKYQSTKFTVNAELMESMIRGAIAKNENQLKINKAFIDKEGNARPKGTTVSLSHKAGQNIGMGYELDERNKIIKIKRSLSTITIVVAVSDTENFLYVVLTAHPTG
ncbi:MAG TPA: hypothetical protein VGW12_13990 [Pyrinomonadaceae bacterium]|nr:hypothetical protein [Pyrinomonadaceae bacterium]